MDIEKFMLGYQTAWQQRDEHAFATLFLPDGHYHNTPFQVQRGHAALASYWQRVKLQEDVKLDFEILARGDNTGIAHWHVTYQVASEELFKIWAASNGTNLLARKAGDPLPRLELDGLLQARFEAGACAEAHIWWHSQPLP